MDDPATGSGEDHDESREQHVVCFDRDLADDDPAPIMCPCDQPFCVSMPDVCVNRYGVGVLLSRAPS